jgi:sec-independent protein translocase protein TatA
LSYNGAELEELMQSLGAPELLIILVIVLLVFGIGRLGKIGGELGSGIRAFRDGLKEPEEKNDIPSEPEAAAPEANPVDEADQSEETPSSDSTENK